MKRDVLYATDVIHFSIALNLVANINNCKIRSTLMNNDHRVLVRIWNILILFRDVAYNFKHISLIFTVSLR